MDFEAQKLCTFSDDSDSDVIEHKELEELYGLPKLACHIKSEEPLTKKKRNGQERERLPTRRPDPNVYNRNALLARENRRKKKQHLETLEINLEECRRVNTVLLEALKRQKKVTRRLQREKQYYKNIVSNRTDIQTLVAALNGRLFEKTPQLNNFSLNQGASSPTSDSLYSRGSHSSHSSNYEPEYHNFDINSDNGTVTGDNIFSLPNFNDTSFLDNLLTEFERPSIDFEDNWEQLLDGKNIDMTGSNIIENSTSETDIDILTNISKDHSYVNSNSEADKTLKDITGICLHVQAGKVSLEFCPTCHWSANQSPPEQLLQQDSVL